MKIGIMTWYKYENYGTALQVVALTKKVESLGYEPRIINYKPKGNIAEIKSVNFKTVKDAALNQINKKIKYKPYQNKEKAKMFDEFINENLIETDMCNSYSELHELNSQLDGFICGSDQIWSPLCFDDKYFLNFADSNKIISYAPSIGSDKIENPEIKEQFKRLVSRFNFLSVREEKGKRIIEELAGKKAEVVLDPTLLLSKDEWDKLSNDSCINAMPKEYMICYFLGDYKKYMKTVKKISRDLNLKIYIIPVFEFNKSNQNYKVPFEVGPKEFISLIKHAKYVCTDSFHGMLFSINYNIPFSIFERFTDKDPRNQNSRIYNILELFNIKNRLVTTNVIDYDIDYNKINIVLNRERAKSTLFLENSLKSILNNDRQITKENKITDYCCGCGACATVCPTKAISIVTDEMGFERYQIDKEKCINCGMCKKVCPMLKVTALLLKNAKKLYAFQSKNEQTLKTSSSGGFSHELCNLYNDNYNICGSTFDSTKKRAYHIIIGINNKEDLERIKGSKYIKSSTYEIFKEINHLAKTEKVIFIGTPCQVAGLSKLLEIKNIRENVILVDLICHGIPTIYLWKKYLKELENVLNLEDNIKVSFRDKNFGWKNKALTISDSRQIIKSPSEKKNNFYSFFNKRDCFMPSCYECPYREKSSADIRIGDYWGNKYKNDSKGVSMIIGITEKGIQIIENMKMNNVGIFKENPLSDYWSVQHPYNIVRPLYWKKLIEDLKDDNKTLKEIRKEYYSFTEFIQRVKDLIKK